MRGSPLSSTCPSRRSVRERMRPRLRNAISRKRVERTSNEKSVVSNISADGQKRTVVPDSSVGAPFLTGAVGTPNLYSCDQWKPSRFTTTDKSVERAFTTEIPTPCKPPDTEYPPSPNFPPACKTVRTTSSAGFFSTGWISTGIPRPLSTTWRDPSGIKVTLISVQ